MEQNKNAPPHLDNSALVTSCLKRYSRRRKNIFLSLSCPLSFSLTLSVSLSLLSACPFLLVSLLASFQTKLVNASTCHLFIQGSFHSLSLSRSLSLFLFQYRFYKLAYASIAICQLHHCQVLVITWP